MSRSLFGPQCTADGTMCMSGNDFTKLIGHILGTENPVVVRQGLRVISDNNDIGRAIMGIYKETDGFVYDPTPQEHEFMNEFKSIVNNQLEQIWSQMSRSRTIETAWADSLRNRTGYLMTEPRQMSVLPRSSMEEAWSEQQRSMEEAWSEQRQRSNIAGSFDLSQYRSRPIEPVSSERPFETKETKSKPDTGYLTFDIRKKFFDRVLNLKHIDKHFGTYLKNKLSEMNIDELIELYRMFFEENFGYQFKKKIKKYKSGKIGISKEDAIGLLDAMNSGDDFDLSDITIHNVSSKWNEYGKEIAIVTGEFLPYFIQENIDD